MTNKKLTSLVLSGLLVFSVLSPVSVLAQTASLIHTGSSSRLQARGANLQARAVTEINNRLKVLNNVISTINNIKRISDSDRSALASQVQTEIQTLNSLLTKIQGDTDIITLRTDVQSITKAYRVFWLFIPKTHILAAADKIDDASSLMLNVVSKLQARITAGGSGAASLQATLTDASSKIADAQTQAQNATNLVISLQPDNGEQTVLQSNTEALQSARTDIKMGSADLRAAYQDFKTIIQALKGLKTSPVPSATP